MATYRLANIVITSTVDAALANGDELIIMWDDVADNFSITKNGSAFTTAGTLLGILDTNYTIIIGVSSTEGGYAIAGYSFCDSTTLNWFRMVTTYPVYPFFELQTTANSPVCATGGTGAVCDIKFSGPPTITHSTDKSTGGSITATATSSNGATRYSLGKYTNYADMTNTSGTFTSLPPGDWTLTAKDTNDCTAILNFKILFKPAEAEHYRFSWHTQPLGQGTTYDARLRIYEREYVGDLVEIDKGDESPFRLFKPRISGHLDDKLFPIHPSSATLSLIAQQDYQFLPLFTQDDKKYRCVYEINTSGTWEEVWQGFITPSVYREDFISTPYSVEIQITDNVRTLEKEKFTDDDDNLLNGSMKLIKVIHHIMKRTGLNLKIRSGVNIFETNHTTTATSDPLDQTYIDVACYREGTEPFTCWEVLEAILRPFGARIVLSDNQWLIEEIDRAYEGYAYRVFDTSGNYESNSTYDPVIDVKGSAYLDRAAMVDEDQSMEVIPAHGKIEVKSKLNYIGSIVSGGFEKEDLLSPGSEVFKIGQGIFTSEEGFRDWTLRQPSGVSGVSFGRIVVSNRGDSSRTGLKTTKEDLTKSVGAFYYTPGLGDVLGWSGNLRDAYLESSVKPYEYGPGDELKFYFEYSTPARPEYEFMVLRVVLKVGSNYLQQDLTWGAAESIYRSYPAVSNSLQKFELSVPVPTTTVLVDSTVQVRIYFYAKDFYDYGTPSITADPADGVAGLKTLVTTGINYDYRVDIRQEDTINGVTNAFRAFRELRIAAAAEVLPFGAIQAGDYNATTNPRIWWPIKGIIENTNINNRTRGADLKFYIDNVSLDALINGQPPPEEDVINLTISKYINENLEVELYNFDVPDIVNAKNMYNNYFRLSNGTPTALWKRSGIDESLPIQSILLKVLGANHSAPTFRITGTFVNEFQRIGFKNYLKITKHGSSLSAVNTEFTSDLSSWEQSVLGETFTWTADNSGSAEVTLTGAGTDSKKLYQAISHKGGYVRFTVNLKALPTAGNTREDVLHAIFYNGTKIIHTEKMVIFAGLTSDTTYDFTYTAFAPGEVTHIGFYIKNVSGSGTCEFQVTQFKPEGTDIEEIYQIADYASNEIANEYTFELMQMSKSFISLAGIDTGGNNQSGGTTGREHSSAYSSAYS
jgi:hypothetical protein